MKRVGSGCTVLESLYTKENLRRLRSSIYLIFERNQAKLPPKYTNHTQTHLRWQHPSHGIAAKTTFVMSSSTVNHHQYLHLLSTDTIPVHDPPLLPRNLDPLRASRLPSRLQRRPLHQHLSMCTWLDSRCNSCVVYY